MILYLWGFVRDDDDNDDVEGGGDDNDDKDDDTKLWLSTFFGLAYT